MDNDLRIPDIYPVNFAKTVTLKVGNIVKNDGTPVGYSFTVEDDYGLKRRSNVRITYNSARWSKRRA